MEFSRPDNARLINKLRVLNALRKKEGLTRAELSTELVLNKVSISEIVSSLLSEGLITEGQKQEVVTGRPGTSLFLNYNDFAVVGVDVSFKKMSMTLSLSNIKGVMLRYEKAPLVREYAAVIEMAIKHIIKHTKAKVVGSVIAMDNIYIDGNIDLPFEYTFVSSLEASVLAEQFSFDNNLKNFEFISWDDDIKSAFITENSIIENKEFGHLPVFSQGLCKCGSIGCLNIATSPAELSKLSNLSLKELLTKEDSEVLDKAVETMARALVSLAQCTNCRAFLIGGVMANLSDYYFAKMQQYYSLASSTRRSNLVIYKSNLKEKGSIQGAVLKALDLYFFKESELKTIGY